MKQEKMHHTSSWCLDGEVIIFKCISDTQNLICAQHNASLKKVNDIILEALALSREYIPDGAIHSEGATDTEL